MSYGGFPKYNRWLEFESSIDYQKYREDKRKDRALWPSLLKSSLQAFESLIDKRKPEPEIQQFLEHHPYFLPGFSDLHHGPYEGIVVTKLPLSNTFVTDFAYVACNSQTLYFTCVEIESARKRLFRQDGKFHRDYLDAKQQIVDWLFWAKDHGREAIDAWGKLFNGKPSDWYDVAFRGFLVFGRRAELNNRVKQERWSAEPVSSAPGIQMMTYDRLLRRVGYEYYDVDNDRIAVCSFRDRRFIVKRVVS